MTRTTVNAPSRHLYDFAFVVECAESTSCNHSGAFGYRPTRAIAKAEALKLARLNASMDPIVTVRHPSGRVEQLMPYAHGKGGGYWRYVD